MYTYIPSVWASFPPPPKFHPSSSSQRTSLVAQMIKNLPAMQETVLSLGWEDPLEKELATHSNILAWRIPIDRGHWQATVHGIAKSWTRLSRLSRHRSSLGWAPVALWQLPACHLFHAWWGMYVNATLSVCPTLSFPPCVHKSVLYICTPIPAFK